MAEQIKAEEELARACAGFSTPDLQRLVNALQAYHEESYKELTNAGQDTVMRAQGKVQAIAKIANVAMESRGIVQKIDALRASRQPVQHVNGMM